MAEGTEHLRHVVQQVMGVATYEARVSEYGTRSFSVYEDDLPGEGVLSDEVGRHFPKAPFGTVGGYVLRMVSLGDRFCSPGKDAGVLSAIISFIRKEPEGHHNINYCFGQQRANEWDSVIMRRLVTHTNRPLVAAEDLQKTTLEDAVISSLEVVRIGSSALTPSDVMKGAALVLEDLTIPSEYMAIDMDASPLLNPAHHVDIVEARALQTCVDNHVGWIH